MAADGYHLKPKQMAKAVCHVRKCSASTFALGQHNDRSNIPPNADERLTHLNVELISHKHNIETAINNRIKQGYTGKTAIRKDAVKAIEINLSGSHDRMREIETDPKLFEAWLKSNQEFLENRYGKENVVSMHCHRDEFTPHIHAVIVPLTPDGRLSAKEVLGTKKEFYNLQNDYAKTVAQFGLERGEIGSKATHTDIKEYSKKLNEKLPEVSRKVERYEQQLEELEERAKDAKRTCNQAQFKLDKIEEEAKKYEPIIEAYNQHKDAYDTFAHKFWNNDKIKPLIDEIKALKIQVDTLTAEKRQIAEKAHEISLLNGQMLMENGQLKGLNRDLSQFRDNLDYKLREAELKGGNRILANVNNFLRQNGVPTIDYRGMSDNSPKLYFNNNRGMEQSFAK